MHLMFLASMALAADTVENYDPGLTDFEAGYGVAAGDFAPDGRLGDASVFVGGGVGDYLGVGVGASSEFLRSGPVGDLSVAAFLGAPRDEKAGVDLLTGLSLSPLDGAIGWSAGVEIDDPGALTPYARTIAFGGTGEGFEGVSQELGLKASLLDDTFQPHIELYTSWTTDGFALPGVAFGPNTALTAATEFTPHFAVEPAADGTLSWQMVLYVIHTHTPHREPKIDLVATDNDEPPSSVLPPIR